MQEVQQILLQVPGKSGTSSECLNMKVYHLARHSSMEPHDQFNFARRWAKQYVPILN